METDILINNIDQGKTNSECGIYQLSKSKLKEKQNRNLHGEHTTIIDIILSSDEM